jgi:hypothetical protein
MGVGVGVIEGSNGEGRDLGSGFVCLFDTIGFFFRRVCFSFSFSSASWFDQS